ncbi:unnamed protein product [Durusdinium trenchii]|uniref:Uncharacterized protein n=1 Tax=Durusdinium trenchii TaxID=1381693 RepID=A0ABP0JVM6_9DINO
MTLALRPRWRPRLPFRPLAASALRLGIRGEAAGEAARAREREVNLACQALSESLRCGDRAWFERVIQQLRQVLLEQQNETALSEVVASASSTVAPRPPPAAPVVSFPLPSTASTSRGTDRRGTERMSEELEEPAWLQALRLLEAAATPRKPSTPSASRSAVGYFPAPEPLEEFSQQLEPEEQLKTYLDQFKEEEPAWAKAIRILEKVPVGREIRVTQTASAASGNPSGAATPQGMLRTPAGQPGHDRGREVRMKSYQAMLHEHALRHAQTERLDVRLQPSEEKSELKQGKLSGQSQSSQVSHSDRWADAPVQDDKNSTIHSIQTEGQGSTTEELARIREQFGLNKPKKQSFTPKEDEVPKSPEPLPKPPSPPTAPSTASDVGIGRGHLVASLPSDGELESEAELRKEDLVWSEHEFNDGDKENRRVLKKFTKEFKKMAEETPEGIRNPKLLTAALDLALACVKCYELDKADAIYRRVLGECRRRGMPWDVKCLQDLATLRCKQHRQADAAELLEELAQKAPPHPATFINLGTVYNQLRQYDKAESWFHQAVNLKGGTPEREDIWNLAICKKNMGQYEEALPMFEEVLREFQVHEPHHPVTIAKVHSSLGGCLHEMGRYTAAAEQFDEAYSLYASTVGRHSPLFGGAAEGKAKALQKAERYEEAFEALLEAFEVHSRCDSVHPTPLFECLEMALTLHEQRPSLELLRFQPAIEDGMANLEQRGQHQDGNAGLVMSRAGKLLSKTSARGAAERLLREGRALIQQAHDAKEANLAHEILEVPSFLGRPIVAGCGGRWNASSFPDAAVHSRTCMVV